MSNALSLTATTFLCWMAAPLILAQTTTLTTVRPSSNLPACTSTVRVEDGDRIILYVALRPDADGPSTTMSVRSNSGRSRTLRGTDTWSEEYVSGGGTERICGQMQGWDRGDVAELSIRRYNRTDLSAKAPVVVDRDNVSYGFTRSSSTPNYSGRAIRVSLFYAVGTQRKNQLHTQILPVTETGATITVSRRGFPKPASGVTGLVAVVDPDGDIPEDNENNNSAVMALPNFQVHTVDRDGATGKLTVKLTVQSSATTFYTPELVIYAKDTNSRDASAPSTVVLARRALTSRSTTSVTFDPDEYPLPRGTNKWLMAVLDERDDTFEFNEEDNLSERKLDGLDEWRLISAGPNVDVYRKDVYSRPAYYLSVSRLQGAFVTGRVETTNNVSFDQHVAQFGAYNTGNQKVRVVINGTFFTGNRVPVAFDKGLRSANVTYPYAGKADSQTSLLAFGNVFPGTIGAVPFSLPTLTGSVYRDLVGVWDGDRVKMNVAGKKDERTWIGFRDPAGNGPLGEKRFSTLITLTSVRESEYRTLIEELKGWGVPQTQQFELDGGGSTSLAVNGMVLKRGSRGTLPLTTLPHAMAIMEIAVPAKVGSSAQPEISSFQSRFTAADQLSEWTMDEVNKRIQESWFSLSELEESIAQAFGNAGTYRLRANGMLVRLSANAAHLWEPVESEPLVALASCRGEIYSAARSGRLYRFDPQAVAIPFSEGVSSLACHGDRLIGLAGNGSLVDLLPGGEPAAVPVLDESADRLAGGSGSSLLVSTYSGRILVLDTEASEWKQVARSHAVHSLTMFGGVPVVLTSSGSLMSCLPGSVETTAESCSSALTLGSAVFAKCSGKWHQLTSAAEDERIVLAPKR